MANWSQLPPELLSEVAKRLGGQIYLIRFRSVCSSWRSSVVARPRNSPSRSPILPYDGISDSSWGFHLSKRTILLVLSPQNSDRDLRRSDGDTWLVKVEDVSPGRTTRLLNPLSRFQINPLPEDSSKEIDLSKFRVFEFGQEFVLQCINFRPFGNSQGDASNLYMEKVVLKYLGNETNNFDLLTIHVSGKLAMYKFGDKKWTIIHDMPSPYDDVILFRDDFYAVDSTGRAVIVDSSANLGMVSSSVFGGDKKFLVESNNELLMADMYLSMGRPGSDLEVEDEDENEDQNEDENDDQFNDMMGEKTVKFKVYRLDQEEKTWVELKSLGDRVLFLGDDCTFSASGLDLGGFKNCIFFMDNFFYNGSEEGVTVSCQVRDIGMYDMETGVIAPLADSPEREKLFWPVPDWIVSMASGVNPVEANQVQAQIEELAL